jgi:coenzyme F420-0:L-glutamate ligase / coenzyme F420-1:gamma-L-glutamate ligase
MSSLSEALRERRSIRKFQSKPVSRELVVAVLEAAGWAPSAHNSQPWRFIVIENQEVKRELAEKMATAWAQDMARDGSTVDEAKRLERRERFANAPVLILACLTLDGLRNFPDQERQQIERDLAVESVGAGLENLLLAAHSLGLGGCWYCAPAFCKSTVRDVLKIPKEIEPSALIMLGYPSESPTAPSRRDTKGFCFLDVWGNPLS